MVRAQGVGVAFLSLLVRGNDLVDPVSGSKGAYGLISWCLGVVLSGGRSCLGMFEVLLE